MHFNSQWREVLLIVAGIKSVYAQQIAWGQCTASSSTSKTTASTTISGTPTTTVSATTTGAAPYPGTTLQSSYYWIRAVESPNFQSVLSTHLPLYDPEFTRRKTKSNPFHILSSYLQASPTAKPGTALLADRSTAGQYQIVSGQLVELIAPNTFLYANVQPPVNSSAVKLSMTFNTTQNTFGTFAFSGDAVTWSVASINRPNLSAWLVCGSQELWINLGNYAYLTPTGCVDETIHYFNGATVD
ncbi:hypothetical protein EYC84_003925 [Monilinia fructicola]|uniref:Carbohydrate-binding module family 1 protein n=1 Tax=Monilinia fructicola TaxID=38448 RepID=A0A5M9K780_MONFR|nr:hypothetical protein EYC84_003925 [Monilinia fructicola]